VVEACLEKREVKAEEIKSVTENKKARNERLQWTVEPAMPFLQSIKGQGARWHLHLKKEKTSCRIFRKTTELEIEDSGQVSYWIMGRLNIRSGLAQTVLVF
jgi:hypothetical protein